MNFGDTMIGLASPDAYLGNFEYGIAAAVAAGSYALAGQQVQQVQAQIAALNRELRYTTNKTKRRTLQARLNVLKARLKIAVQSAKKQAKLRKAIVSTGASVRGIGKTIRMRSLRRRLDRKTMRAMVPKPGPAASLDPMSLTMPLAPSYEPSMSLDPRSGQMATAQPTEAAAVSEDEAQAELDETLAAASPWYTSPLVIGGGLLLAVGGVYMATRKGKKVKQNGRRRRNARHRRHGRRHHR